MDKNIKKKNILDLHFQKYLVIASTSVIILFTYFIGLGIALLTRQIRLDNFLNISLLFSVSAGIISICSTLLFNSLFHLKNIPRVVKSI